MAIDAPLVEGSCNGADFVLVSKAANGTTEVTVSTKFSTILAGFVTWSAGATNPTYLVYPSTAPSGGNFYFKCDHDAETSDVHCLIFGRV